VKRQYLCFISAGEHSGDLLGAELYLQLKARMPRLEAFGTTGAAMETAGIESIASTNEFGFMGFFEILKRLPQLLELESRILSEIDRRRPNAAILVDFPGFHFRLAEQLRLRGIKVIQYVAPKLWAWGENRIGRLRRDFDLVLGILPFEESFFTSRSVNYKFVGNPQKDRTSKVIVSREALGFNANQKIIVCLPGSRTDEINRMFPIIYSTIAEMRKASEGLEFIVPMATNLSINDYTQAFQHIDANEKLVTFNEAGLTGWKWKSIRFFTGMSLEMMAAADAAIVTSGTATLECALLGTPLVVVYAMSSISYEIAKTKAKISDFSLVNLIGQRKIVTEYIQKINIREVAEEVTDLISETSERSKVMKEDFLALGRGLSGNAAWVAATAIGDLIDQSAVPHR
jgi:lipid-A-disaccharide synthase